MSGITFEITGDDNLQTLARELREFVPKRLPRAIARDVIPPVERLLDRLIDERLRVYPPARGAGSPRFVWSYNAEKNARARRWFFANYPNGYTRSGLLGRAWLGDITYQNDTLTTRVSNPSKAASYVYGSEPFNFEQVPGHARTGWLNSGTTAADVLLEVAIEIDKRLDETIDQELERL